jgi:hypothetical protein
MRRGGLKTKEISRVNKNPSQKQIPNSKSPKDNNQPMPKRTCHPRATEIDSPFPTT